MAGAARQPEAHRQRLNPRHTRQMPTEIILSLDPGNRDTFHGVVHTRLIASAEVEFPLKVYYVRFEPTARTHWHFHAGDQVLAVTSGRCRYQREGEEIREAGAGESIRFRAGVRHWHGAAPAEAAEHIAMNLECRETTWLQEVTSAEYDPGSTQPDLSDPP